MEPLLSYLCLPAILFQTIFASSSLNGSASLLINKTASFKNRKSRPRAKPIASKLVGKKKLPNAKKKSKRICKRKDVVATDSNSKFLIELLPKELFKMVIDYFNDNLYSILVSTPNWSLEDNPRITINSARVYVKVNSTCIKSLNHSLGNIREDERRCIEFANPHSYSYEQFANSQDGRYVLFSHSCKASADPGEQAKRSIKWLAQSNELDDEEPTSVVFDGENSNGGIMSRDGKTLCSYNSSKMKLITCVYQVKEEAEKNPVAFMKFELNGAVLAVSGKGNRILVATAGQLEIHEIDKDASSLVFQIDKADFGYICALNEDGRKAAFVTKKSELQIMEVDKVVGTKTDQLAIIATKFPKPAGRVSKLVYDDRGKLQVLHGGKVSLFDSSAKKLILLEAPQEETTIDLAISPNADYIVILLGIGKSDKYGRFKKYQTIVKRKFGKADWKGLFGCEADEDNRS